MITIAACDIHSLRYPLSKPTGGSGLTAIDVVLARMISHEGEEGWGFSYVLRGGSAAVFAAARALAEQVRGALLFHPAALWAKLALNFNRTGAGPNRIALAAIDVAAWDLWSKSFGMPLYAAMGGAPRSCPLYSSGDFSPSDTPEQAAEKAAAAMGQCFAGVKLRVAGCSNDRALLRVAREAIGDDALLMADANEKYDLPTAVLFARQGAEEGLFFLEEPLAACDWAGLRRLSALASVPLAAGEHIQTFGEGQRLIDECSVTIVQPDLATLGGLTPCDKIVRYAAARGAVTMPHFLPGLFVHLAAAHRSIPMLEDFPLLEPLFSGWPTTVEGMLLPRDVPGHGLAPKTASLTEFRITD